MDKKSIYLMDGSFKNQKSIGLGGENCDVEPETMVWNRDFSDRPELCVYTELNLSNYNPRSSHNIGLLLEPNGLRTETYKVAKLVKDHFNVIFTYNKAMIDLGPPFMFYPLGGSWINQWGLYDKSRLVSMIEGFKQRTEGHKLRHRLYDLYHQDIDFYAHDGWFEPKHEALRPYRYSVVVENSREDIYFSEKLIDCFSQGTIPIYWGAPSVGEFFDTRGFYTFENEEELGMILHTISDKDFERKMKYIEANIRYARQYRCPEDWLMKNRMGFFDD